MVGPDSCSNESAGPDMLTTLGRRPWSVLQLAGPALARAQVAVNDVPAPIQDFLR